MDSVAPDGIDRRQHPRVRASGDVTVSQSGRALGPVCFQNLSLGGAMLVGNVEAPTVGSPIEATVTSGRLQGVSFQAEVRWAVVQACSVRFGVRILPAQAKLIQDIVLEELDRAERDTGESSSEPFDDASQGESN